jgi:hypothetical protein
VRPSLGRRLRKPRGPHPSTPPCRKSKDYDAINLHDDIAPGSVSFIILSNPIWVSTGGFPILEYVVGGSFDEIELYDMIHHCELARE